MHLTILFMLIVGCFGNRLANYTINYGGGAHSVQHPFPTGVNVIVECNSKPCFDKDSPMVTENSTLSIGLQGENAPKVYIMNAHIILYPANRNLAPIRALFVGDAKRLQSSKTQLSNDMRNGQLREVEVSYVLGWLNNGTYCQSGYIVATNLSLPADDILPPTDDDPKSSPLPDKKDSSPASSTVGQNGDAPSSTTRSFSVDSIFMACIILFISIN